jgi:hypothetical protein
MPKLLTALTVIGTAAMLWVGGHILLVGMHDLGRGRLYDAVHHLEDAAKDATGRDRRRREVAGRHRRERAARAGRRRLLVLVMSLTLHRKAADAHH